MKRAHVFFFVCFLIYTVMIAAYFFQDDLFAVPVQDRGSVVDPQTFMSAEQIEKAESYTRIRYLSFFLETPLQMVVLILIMGLSIKFRNWVEKLLKWRFLQLTGYLVLFSVLTVLIYLPVDAFFFYLDHYYGISHTPLQTWLKDMLIDMGLNLLYLIPVMSLFYWVMKKSPQKWWFWAWLVSIPIIFALVFIQPVLIEPLYHDYQELQDEALKQDILQLAAQANIPAEQVYEVNMSERTNAVNAYVSGLGSSSRIVLWDTTLEKMDEDEIMTVMAHEMGHYVQKHILWSLLIGIALSLGGFWLLYHVFRLFILNWGSSWGIKSGYDLAAIPIIFLIISMFSLAVTPIENAVSRQYERAADAYSMEMTGDGEAAISAFQKIAAENLGTMRQPSIVRIFLGSHPPLEERIKYFQQFIPDE